MFSPDELKRYARHFSLAAVGVEGQEKIKSARILCVGAGGLGSPVLLYLSALGLGHIGIVDADPVDLSNLQRQIIYTTQDLGHKKTTASKARIRALNPFVKVTCHDEFLTTENALGIIQDYDLVIDCTDNFPTRYLVNDACFTLEKPYIYASISQFEGQCSVFCAKDGPCYRCLYPEPPPAGLVPNCSEEGVLGVLPGLLGTLQAIEAVKVLLGLGEALIGKLLHIDTLFMRFDTFTLNKKADCLLCGKHTPFSELPKYEKYCHTATVPSLSVQELKSIRDHVFLLDVREPFEYELCNLNACLMPLATLSERLTELRKLSQGLPIVVHCKAGPRSKKAAALLLQHGFTQVRFLEGGILDWINVIDPSMMSY